MESDLLGTMILIDELESLLILQEEMGQMIEIDTIVNVIESQVFS